MNRSPNRGEDYQRQDVFSLREHGGVSFDSRQIQMVHGLRAARDNMLLASLSPTKRSCVGSHFNLRPRRKAMSATLPIVLAA